MPMDVPPRMLCPAPECAVWCVWSDGARLVDVRDWAPRDSMSEPALGGASCGESRKGDGGASAMGMPVRTPPLIVAARDPGEGVRPSAPEGALNAAGPGESEAPAVGRAIWPRPLCDALGASSGPLSVWPGTLAADAAADPVASLPLRREERLAS